MRIDYRVVQQPSLFVEAGELAAVAVAGVYGERTLLAYRGPEQQLAQVLPEDPDALFVGLMLGFPDHFPADRRIEQALERVGGCQPYLGGKGFGGVAAVLAEVVVYLRCAFLGVGVYAYADEAFGLGPEYGQQVVRGNPVERIAEIEIAAVLRRFGILPAGLRDGGPYAARAEDRALVFPYLRRLGEPFGYYVPCTLKGVSGAWNLVGSILCRLGERVACGERPHGVGERFESPLPGLGRPGAPLWPVGKVEVFEFGGAEAVFDPFLHGLVECSGLRDCGKYGLLALLHFSEHVAQVLEFGHGGVVQAARLFLAVTAYERYGVALGEHLHAVLHLPGLYSEQPGYMSDVQFLHFAALVNLRNLRAITPQKASPNMLPDILDVPALRLTNITGTSAMRNPSLWAVYFNSIWKP